MTETPIQRLASAYRARTGDYGSCPVPRHVPYQVADDIPLWVLTLGVTATWAVVWLVFFT